jgi:hypothetical protein
MSEHYLTWYHGGYQPVILASLPQPSFVESANIALTPKRVGAKYVCDFRPISLIHAIGKLLFEMIAARLASHMEKLVSNAQSAFIK